MKNEGMPPTREGSDLKALGMSHWESGDCDNLSNYTLQQLEWVRPYMGSRIMEIGAGGGRVTKMLHETMPVQRLVGIEPSPILYDQFRERCPDVESYSSVVCDLPATLNGQFDTILLVHVLEHIEHDQAFLHEASRFLNPGGRFIILVPALNWLMSRLDRNIGHFRRYDRSMIRELSDALGFITEMCRYDNLIGIPGWFVLCKVLGMHYQEPKKKRVLMTSFNVFDKRILPLMVRLERRFPPPIGLHLTAVLKVSPSNARA